MDAGLLSPASKVGNDGEPDQHADVLRDEISPYVLREQDVESDDGQDPWDRADMEMHRKQQSVLNMKRRSIAAKTALVQVEGMQLSKPSVETMLLRNATLAHGVWTMGQAEQGQTGHAVQRPPNEPFPASVELRMFRGGVRSVHCTPLSTIAISMQGVALGFGSGPFRGAASSSEEETQQQQEEAGHQLEYEGAPPFRVRYAPIREGEVALPTMEAIEGEDEWSGLDGSEWGHSATSDSAAVPKPPLPDTKLKNVPLSRYTDTLELVYASANLKRAGLAAPVELSGILMAMQQIEGGEDFCMALMENGLVFAWGDGDEGKLGLGRIESCSRPTMVDFLMPSEYAQAAKQSAAKDAIHRAGAKIIRSRSHNFRIVSLACGARHTLALSSAGEAFSWGSGCCGQLGHGSLSDEALPHPVQAFKSKDLSVVFVAAGSYHSAAVVQSKKVGTSRLFSWGNGNHGRLGVGDDRLRPSPVEVFYHRTKPRESLQRGADGKGASGGGMFGGLVGGARTDWLGPESGHEHEWFSVAGGGRHSVASTANGQVFTWGDDKHGQLGHGQRVGQRLPCLLSTLLRRDRYELVADVRQVAAGRRFSVALTWGGEVYVWGELGGYEFPIPKWIDGLRGASIVSISAGEGHLAMLTGDAQTGQQYVEHGEAQRAVAGERLKQALAKQREKQAMQARAAAAAAAAAKVAARKEKNRSKFISRLTKQRDRLKPKEKKKEQGGGQTPEQKEAEQKQAKKAVNEKLEAMRKKKAPVVPTKIVKAADA